MRSQGFTSIHPSETGRGELAFEGPLTSLLELVPPKIKLVCGNLGFWEVWFLAFWNQEVLGNSRDSDLWPGAIHEVIATATRPGTGGELQWN